jgi:aspartate/methionine/tyrosine aminotransferase
VLTVLAQGDEIAGMTPEFPMHRSVPQLLGHSYLPWEPRISQGRFNYDLSDLERLIQRHPRLKALILSYPGNPAPFMFSEDHLRAIVELCLRRPIRLYVDAPYFEVIFPQIQGNAYPNIFRAHPRAQELVTMALSESKALAMPGRRIGYAIAPAGIVRAFARLGINIYSCPNVMNDLLMTWAYTDGFDELSALSL